MNIKQKLEIIKKVLGLTQTKLAEKFGVLLLRSIVGGQVNLSLGL